MKTALYVKTLHFRLERDNGLLIRGMVTNRAGFGSAPVRITVELRDARGTVAGRAAAVVPAIEKYGTYSFEARCRTKQDCFFTAACSLEKLRDVDYSDFDFSTQSWSRNAGNCSQSSGRKS